MGVAQPRLLVLASCKRSPKTYGLSKAAKWAHTESNSQMCVQPKGAIHWHKLKGASYRRWCSLAGWTRRSSTLYSAVWDVTTANSPVALCGDSHLQKYSAGYRSVFPAANLLLVQSHSSRIGLLGITLHLTGSTDFFWTRNSVNRAALVPAVAYLDSRGITASGRLSGDSKLLLHAFSNGGAAQMNTLGELLKIRNAKEAQDSLTRHTLPAKTIIIDSAPGGEALPGLITAFSMPLPGWRKPLRAISVTVFWTILKLYKAIVRPPPIFVDKIRAQLIDPTILPQGKPCVDHCGACSDAGQQTQSGCTSTARMMQSSDKRTPKATSRLPDGSAMSRPCVLPRVLMYRMSALMGQGKSVIPNDKGSQCLRQVAQVLASCERGLESITVA